MLRIGNYFRAKSIKLSDSYTCTVYNKEAEPVECIQCIGFTAPKILQYNEEVYKYGNLAQKFLIPKLDVVHEFTIDFFNVLHSIPRRGEFDIGIFGSFLRNYFCLLFCA